MVSGGSVGTTLRETAGYRIIGGTSTLLELYQILKVSISDRPLVLWQGEGEVDNLERHQSTPF